MTPENKHTYFYICEECGAHLDPGEKCDCLNETGNNSILSGKDEGGGEKWDLKRLKTA